MSYLTLAFPIIFVLFVLLWFFGCIPFLRKTRPAPLADDARDHSIRRTDWIAIFIVTAVYAVVVFIYLGINIAPQSFHHFSADDYVTIELDQPQELSSVMYYTGLHPGDYVLEFSADGANWTAQAAMEQSYANLFKWQYAKLNEENEAVSFIRITSGKKQDLGEVALYGADGALISADTLSYDSDFTALFDEQETIPDSPNPVNSSIFDEVYHARTAYEHITGVYPYETTHPPLGKLIISVGIRIFGMTPFGWRFMGTLFGVLMLPALFIFLKKLFGSTAVSVCGTLLFAFDFMHYTQTRIATIDTYAVFFILLIYLFMYLYVTESAKSGDSRRSLLWLFMCGLSFGLGAASKWTVFYGGAGIALIWLAYRIYLIVKAPEKRPAFAAFEKNVLWCILFFVLIPGVIYYASYYPYGTASGLEGGISMYFTKDYAQIVWNNQKYMFNYHANVDATHSYSSRWYEWVLDIRPILYYLNYISDTTKSCIGAFSNPVLCWAGIPAMLSMAWLSVAHRDKKALFILVGYLAQLLPWVFVTRITFAYHYFPATVFIVLAVCHLFSGLRRYDRHWKYSMYGFTAVCLVLFAAFYPVLSGIPFSRWYTTSFLDWLPAWPF